MKPHKHAELIKQWADGAIVQYLDGDRWKDVNGNDPIWSREVEQYRIKPEPPKYPQTRMTDDEILKAVYYGESESTGKAREYRDAANAAIARCIQDGDVVPAAIHDRAIRALKRSGFADNGAEEWKPPVTNAAEGMVPEAMLDKLYDRAMEAAVARMLANSLGGREMFYGWRGLLHELLHIDKQAIIEAVKHGK